MHEAILIMKLLDPLFRWEPVTRLFSDDACLQRILDFEAALARAEASAGLIPSSAALAIAAKCRAELFHHNDLAKAAGLAGNLAIPVVKHLKQLVAADNTGQPGSKAAANFVHWGATSQDALDTGCVLQLREALTLISTELEKLCDALAKLADEHRATPIVGRTWMQHAVPTTLGMKFAGWLDSLTRHRQRLREAQTRSLALQFGGAVGTLASLGACADAIAQHLAKDLKLSAPAIPWHSHRDRMAEIAATLGLLTGTLGKIARDISLHLQTEIGELSEPSEEGRGGSSTMPHKHNPVAAAAVLSAAIRVPALVSTMLTAMLQEDERGLGGWHSEWETLPEIVCLTAGALHHLATTTPKLVIDRERMKENLKLTRGLIFAEALASALGEKVERSEARSLVDSASARASNEKRQLHEIIEQDKNIAQHFTATELDALFDARNYTGMANQFIDRVLEQHKAQHKGSR